MGEETKTYLTFSSLFPNSMDLPLEQSSPETRDYNCVSWALKDVSAWREPSGHSTWEEQDAPEEESLDAVMAFFSKHRFLPCENGRPEEGFEKIALFSDADGCFQHVARLLPSGKWTSKLGSSFDVVHELEALEGGIYGDVRCFMRKSLAR